MGRLAILIATVLWVGGASAQTLDIDRMSDADFKKLTPEQTKYASGIQDDAEVRPSDGKRHESIRAAVIT